MNSNSDLLSFFNETNYENFVKVNNLNSLIDKMVIYFTTNYTFYFFNI